MDDKDLKPVFNTLPVEEDEDSGDEYEIDDKEIDQIIAEAERKEALRSGK